MPTALIVDDNTQNLYFLEVLLKSHGFAVVPAANGAEALEAAVSSPPDLIISDVLMPVMDGFALCRKVKGIDSLKMVPFIFYSATFTESKDVEFGLSIGADRYVIKPQEPEALMQIILDVLAEHGTGAATAPDPGSPEDTETNQMYGEVIFHKLEKKVAELEETNAELILTIAEREAAEEEIRKLNVNLEKRVMERTAQLESSNKELEAFSYSVSHDLRAPLRAIDGFSQALLEDYADTLDGQGKNYVERIRKETQRMAWLIDDILKLSRISRLECSFQSVDLSKMVREITNERSKSSPERTVEVVIEEGIVVEGDQSLMRIALDNLIENAWKFTGKKEVARIEIGRIVKDGEAVIFIRDNGAGFDMAYADKLFGAFQRLHSTTEFPGTGIGLTIVQRIIHRHGGEIWAEGEDGKGATFYFTVPVAC